MKKKVALELCNDHLKSLFRAIERGDAKSVYEIEHKLTHEEECVACAYAYKARGAVREVLDVFLQQEGFLISEPMHLSTWQEVKYWTVRIGLLLALGSIFVKLGVTTKSYLFASAPFYSLGSFGLIGVIMATISTYVLLENWLLGE